MSEAEFELAKRLCMELWSLDNPDLIDVYHALRILRLRTTGQEPSISFDDFCVDYKLYSRETQ